MKYVGAPYWVNDAYEFDRGQSSCEVTRGQIVKKNLYTVFQEEKQV